MDLILWRHAEAQEWPAGDPRTRTDLERALTSRGERQAARMAQWLDRQLPGSARILSSPARRCEQTAQALERRFRICNELAPGPHQAADQGFISQRIHLGHNAG